MKTIRKIGMALMAVLMSVNFTSCSNEDEDSETQPSNKKKLARVMRYEQDGGTMTIDFKYDKKGNVVKAAIWHRHNNYGEWREEVDTIEYVWDSNKSITWDCVINVDYNLNPWKGTYNCTLNDSRITDITHDNHSKPGFIYGVMEKFYYRYNEDGHINEYGDFENGTIHRIYTWNNNQLERFKVGSNAITFSYNNQTCKSFFPLLIDYSYIGFWYGMKEWQLVGDYIFMAQPELIGIRSNSLPTKIINNDLGETYSFNDYDFDSEGYVTRCTVSGEWQTDGSSFCNYIYKFIWE